MLKQFKLAGVFTGMGLGSGTVVVIGFEVELAEPVGVLKFEPLVLPGLLLGPETPVKPKGMGVVVTEKTKKVPGMIPEVATPPGAVAGPEVLVDIPPGLIIVPLVDVPPELEKLGWVIVAIGDDTGLLKSPLLMAGTGAGEEKITGVGARVVVVAGVGVGVGVGVEVGLRVGVIGVKVVGDVGVITGVGVIVGVMVGVMEVVGVGFVVVTVVLVTVTV